jgi:hypothetical protein
VNHHLILTRCPYYRTNTQSERFNRSVHEIGSWLKITRSTRPLEVTWQHPSGGGELSSLALSASAARSRQLQIYGTIAALIRFPEINCVAQEVHELGCFGRFGNCKFRETIFISRIIVSASRVMHVRLFPLCPRLMVSFRRTLYIRLTVKNIV